MKRSIWKMATVAVAVGIVVSGSAAPASAATKTYSSEVCAPALRPAIYGASVGFLELTIYAPAVNRADSWYNTTRTTRVKLTNVGEYWSNGGKATYTGTLTDKGQDCRLL